MTSRFRASDARQIASEARKSKWGEKRLKKEELVAAREAETKRVAIEDSLLDTALHKSDKGSAREVSWKEAHSEIGWDLYDWSSNKGLGATFANGLQLGLAGQARRSFQLTNQAIDRNQKSESNVHPQQRNKH